jgi:hypothetical protein
MPMQLYLILIFLFFMMGKGSFIAYMYIVDITDVIDNTAFFE